MALLGPGELKPYQHYDTDPLRDAEIARHVSLLNGIRVEAEASGLPTEEVLSNELRRLEEEARSRAISANVTLRQIEETEQ